MAAKNKKLPKWVRERQHAKAMALSRYGVNLNQAKYRSVVSQIQKGHSKFVGKVSNSRSLHLVTVIDDERGPVNMKVIYDKDRKELVTVLKMDMDVYTPYRGDFLL